MLYKTSLVNNVKTMVNTEWQYRGSDGILVYISIIKNGIALTDVPEDICDMYETSWLVDL